MSKVCTSAREGYFKVSFDKTQLHEIKRQATNNRPYADRVSLSFAIQLALVTKQFGEGDVILGEIDKLERIRPRGRLREKPFRHPPLSPFWHIHWSAPRHIMRNVGIHWNLAGEASQDRLTPMLQEVAKEYGNDTALWPGIAAHRLVIEGYRKRAERGLTGDWMIYGKHENLNYYLALATHDEAKEPNASRLYDKLQQGSAADFPFLFETQQRHTCKA